MKIGLIHAAGEPMTIQETLAKIVQSEKDGFATCWVASIFGHDALTVIALAGQVTSRIELGTAVVPTYPRHPHSLAQQAATVNASIGGRLALGLGRSHKLVIEDILGLSYEKPITHIREYVSIVRALTTEGACAVNGKMYRVNAPLTIPDAKPLPILVGALMPKMLELCGELCDGTLTWMCGPKYLGETIVPSISAAADTAGRAQPRVVCSLPICVTDDVEGARAVAAKAFSVYGTLPVYRACLDAEGAEGPADIALIGNEQQVRAGLDRIRDAGASDYYGLIFPDGSDDGSSERSYELLKSLGGEL